MLLYPTPSPAAVSNAITCDGGGLVANVDDGDDGDWGRGGVGTR